jgi:nucleoid-associated protein YgaU
MRLKPGTMIVIPPLTDVRPDGAASLGGRQASPAGARTGAREQTPVDPRTEYRVEPNESLYKIAVKLYGDGIRHVEIYELNKQLIGPDPAKLKVGTVLKLPAPPTSHMSAASGR